MPIKKSIMFSQVYEEECVRCKENQKCHLCNMNLCDSCKVEVNNRPCCRPCSASIRNEVDLTKYFVEWHNHHDLGGVVLTKKPDIILLPDKVFFAASEFEYKKLIGSVSYRSDGQCDVDIINVDTEKSTHGYRILVNNDEIDEFLNSVFSLVNEQGI